MQTNGRCNSKNERRSILRSSAVLTALLVILLIFAALTTATFAWFSSNRSVTAGTTEFTANNSDSGGDLQIYWGADKNGSGMEITMNPMLDMPPTTPVRQFAVGDLLSTARFQTAVQKGYEDEAVFADVASVDVGTMVLCGDTRKDPPVKEMFFTVANAAPSPIATEVKFRASFGNLEEKPNSDILRVAVFVATSAPNSLASYKYCGTLGHEDNTDTFYGEITNDALVSSQHTYAAATTVKIADGIPGNDKVFVKLVAWFDGHQLTSDRAGESASATFSVELA